MKRLSRRVLTKILTEENDAYEVDEAEDGALGLEKVKKEDYDLVLCDIKIPKMDGVEVLEAAKQLKPEVPFVMISGHGEFRNCRKYYAFGSLCYISKPP